MVRTLGLGGSVVRTLGRDVSVVRTLDSQLREPGFESCCCFKTLAISSTSRCFSSLAECFPEISSWCWNELVCQRL